MCYSCLRIGFHHKPKRGAIYRQNLDWTSLPQYQLKNSTKKREEKLSLKNEREVERKREIVIDNTYRKKRS
jgi:hypothetical protein